MGAKAVNQGPFKREEDGNTRDERVVPLVTCGPQTH